MSTDKNAPPTDNVGNSLVRLRERVRSRLGEMRISAREASRRAGFNVGYVGDLLEGRSKAPEIDRIMRLAETLELPLGDLIGDAIGEAAATRDPKITDLQEMAAQGAGNGSGMIPLYSARIAMNKPLVPLEWKPVGLVPSLPNLQFVEGAYAVRVFNSLNEPRYFLGETIFVSPAEMIEVGDFTFGRHKDGRAGVGRLVALDDGRATWAFCGAPDLGTVSVDLAEMEFVHRIVGSVG